LSAPGRWVRAGRNATAGPFDKKPALALAERDGLARLRKETERLRMERETLKSESESKGNLGSASIPDESTGFSTA
jgi:transposase-like protein